MSQMPYLVRIGSRGFNLRQMTHWLYTPAGSTYARSQLIIYLSAQDRCGDYIGQGYETFHGDEADALHAYLDDMSVDVLELAAVYPETLAR